MNIPKLGLRPRVLGISNIGVIVIQMKRFILIWITLVMSGCTTHVVKSELPCPQRPVLTAIPEDIQLRMGEDAVFIVGSNQIALKTYAKKLEVRSGCAIT